MRAASAVLLLAFAAVYVAAQQDLFDYVNAPDPNYAYYDTGLRIGNASLGWTGYILNMTSQAWLLPSDTDHPVWTHQLVVIVPHNLKYTNVSAIYVTGGGNGDGPPSADSEDVLVPAILAKESGSVTATLFQVPNQPIVFTADPLQKERSEDALVAFSWSQYMKNTDRPEWVSLLPMVKSVVRAMDTVQDFTSKLNIANIQNFAIAGASKRGWTTWLTGAADKRVIGIMPIVMDLLNFQQNLLHMYQSYGGWTFAFEDYYAMNITQDFGTPGLAALSKIIDPLVYKDYLTMPKLVIDSTGDEFFMPDDDWLWWGQLEGETYRLMIQNAEHSMATGVIELLKGAQAFYDSLILQTQRPKFDWTMDYNGGVITVTTQQKPIKVMLRFATTFGDARRDFRLVKGDTPADPCEFIPVKIFGEACINPVLWFGESIAPTSTANGTYTYVATQPLPDKGWRGFFLELFYEGPANSAYRLTTQVAIIPNTYPFPPCDQIPAGCKGVLV